MKSTLNLLETVLGMLSAGVVSTLALVLIVRPFVTTSQTDAVALRAAVSLSSSFMLGLALLLCVLSGLSLFSLFIIWRLKKGKPDA